MSSSQADEIDVADYVGWSVCGVGEAYALVDPVRLADLPVALRGRGAPIATGR